MNSLNNLLKYPEILEEFNLSCSQILNYRIQKIFPNLKQIFCLLKSPKKYIDWESAVIYNSAKKGYDKVFEENFLNSRILESTLFEQLFIGGSVKILELVEKKYSHFTTYVNLENLVKYNRMKLTLELINKKYTIDRHELTMYACIHDNLKFFTKFNNIFGYELYLETVCQYDSINIFNYLGEILYGKCFKIAIYYSRPDKCEIAKIAINQVKYNDAYRIINYFNKPFLIPFLKTPT